MIMYYNEVAGLFDYAQRAGFRIIVVYEVTVYTVVHFD